MGVLCQPIVDGAGPSVDFDAFVGNGQEFDPGFEAGGDVGIRGSGGDGRAGWDGVVGLYVEAPAGCDGSRKVSVGYTT